MDWNMVIEGNRDALRRIVAMLVAMAGLAGLTSPLAGEDGSARRGEAEASAEPGEGAPTLPRHLYRAILRLLRPAESAVRRLIIVAARGLVVALPPTRPRKLLLHAREIARLIGGIHRQGMTLVPLKLYFNARGIAKVELGLAKGKKLHDKRETEKRRDWDRQKRRLMREKG